MANAFNIDKGGSTTSDTHLLNETFHVFSKSPGSPTTSLGGARLKSGHTTTASDVWADEIPAFFNAATQAKFDLFGTKAVKDDLCLFNGNVYKHNGTEFVSLGTEAEILVDGAKFSKNGKEVVKFHKGRTAINLTADNNNGDGSNDYTAKIYNAATGSTTFVPQFISAMDKVVDGIPSLGYDAAVFEGTTQLAEGLTADNDYICNAYAGVIQFNKARKSGITVNAWEYIGDKLNTTISDLAAAVFGEGEPGGEDVSLTQKVAQNTAAIAKLNGTEDGSVSKAVSVGVAEAKQFTTDEIAKISTGVQSVTKDGTSDLLTVGGTATDVTISLSDTVATKAYAESQAATAEQNAKSEAATNLANAKTNLEGQIASAKSELTDTINTTKSNLEGTIETSKTEAIAAAKTETESQVGAAKTELSGAIDTAKTEAIAAAKGETESQVAAAKGELTTAIDTAKTQAIAAAKSETESQVAALKTELTTGEGSLAGKVTALEGEVSTIKETTIPAAQAAAEKVATDGIAALKNTLEEGVIATAQATADQAVKDAAAAKTAGETAAAAALAEARAKVASVTVTDGTGTITSGGTATAPVFTVAAGTIEEGKLVTGTTVKAHVAAEIAKVNDAADTLAGRVTTAEDKINTLKETTVPAIQKSITDLKAVSLAKSSADGLVKVSTTGTVGTGIESITVEVSDTVAQTTDTLSATSTGSNNVEVVLGGTIAQPTLTVTGTDIASAQALATLTQTVNTHIAEAAGLYLSVEKVDALPKGNDRKTNKIYLLPLDTEAGRAQNIHTEYIWTGSAWEIIGTTAIDINSLEAAAKTAKAAADKAQGEVDALETVVETLTTTVGTNKTAAETGISEAKAAAKAAQDDVDELDGVVSALSQTVASNKLTTDAAITEITGTTIPAITGRLDVIEKIPVVEVVASEGDGQYITVGRKTEGGKTTFTVGTTGALETRLDTLESFIGGGDDPSTGLSELLAKKVDGVTGGSNGITISTANVTEGRIATLSVTADTTATENSTNVVTSGAVFTAVKGALDAAAEAKQIAESKIGSVTATTEATHFGSSLVTAATTGTDVTITVAPAKEWQVGTTKPASTITSVINGKMSDGSTIDDANLVDGTAMFTQCSKLKTYIGDLGNLTNGTDMFKNCELLETFVANLSSLVNAPGMFLNTYLNGESMIYIADSLPDYSGDTSGAEHKIDIGIPAGADTADFLTAEAVAEIRAKGWTLTLQYD